MDSTLAQGVLDRLDAVAATMGVAANRLWDIWLATSWRPMLNEGIMLLAVLVLFGWTVFAFGWCLPRAERTGEGEDAVMGSGLITAFIGMVVLVLVISNLGDAITYLRVPEVYALDQLRALVGK